MKKCTNQLLLFILLFFFRNLKVNDEGIVKEAVEHLEKNGFINYFGLQRFGNSSLVPTYAVGKAILKGDWKLVSKNLCSN